MVLDVEGNPITNEDDEILYENKKFERVCEEKGTNLHPKYMPLEKAKNITTFIFIKIKL